MEFNGSHTDVDIANALNKTSGDGTFGGAWTEANDGINLDPLTAAELAEQEKLAKEAGV